MVNKFSEGVVCQSDWDPNGSGIVSVRNAHKFNALGRARRLRGREP
jgi:hypothetical protein